MAELIKPAPMADQDLNDYEAVQRVFETEEILLLAYERAGVIKPLAEVTKPIADIIRPSDDNPLKDARDEKAIRALSEEEGERNALQQTIVEMLNLRRQYTEDSDEIKTLRLYARGQIRYGVPLVMEELRAMVSDSFQGDTEQVDTTEEAKALASGVYWMIHRLKAAEAQKVA